MTAPGYGMDEAGGLYELQPDGRYRPLVPHPTHPLASKDGMTSLWIRVQHSEAWRGLTKPQQRTLRSGVGAAITWRCLERELLAQRTDDGWAVTDYGRWLVAGADRWGRPVVTAKVTGGVL